MLYMCIEYHIYVNMYHVSAQGVDERMINVHYYYYYYMHDDDVALNVPTCWADIIIRNKDTCIYKRKFIYIHNAKP